MAAGYADVDAADPADAADAASAEPSSSCRLGEQADDSPPPGPTVPPHEPSPSSASSKAPSSAAAPPPESSSMQRTRTTSFPISFPPIFFQRSKVPSASLAPSTAEGRPVRVTDPADTHHTSALQKLNSKYPSAVRRHGYTPEAPSAQSSTYSQPVLVRTYSGPPPSQGSRSTRSRQHRPPSSGRAVSRRVPLPSASTPGSGGPGRPIQPTVSGVGVGTTSSLGTGIDRHSTDQPYESSVYGVSMPRPYKPKKPTAGNSSRLPLSWPWQSSRQEPGEPKLPPLDAFSFKSFMADLEVRGGDNDIGADLDRIAEICARSRYSLSNQYEVHVAPHGSGDSFMSAAGPSPSSVPRRKGHSRSRSHGAGGPTLQAITSDDENHSRSQPRRRNPGKRRNTAYGTLETIMSSSRSSEEDKSKKKSASELVGEVRGRAAKKAWDNSASASTSTGNGADPSSTEQQQHPNPTTTIQPDPAKLARKKSASFATAIIDSSKTATTAATTTTSSSSRRHTKKPPSLPTASALLSEPARPQTSNSHLGVRTSPAPPATLPLLPTRSRPQSRSRSRQATASAAAAASGGGGGGGGRSVSSSGWAGWMPWRGGLAGGELPPQQQQQASHAEGSLRLLLRAGSSSATAAGSTAGGEAGG